jgi:hypothetical protein
MQLHDEKDQHLHPMRHSQIDSPSANAKFVMRRHGTLVRQGFQRPEVLLHDAGIVDDSPVITMCYEAHLSMQKMLAAFAELRGDDAADTIG